jgi:hypothetical protein
LLVRGWSGRRGDDGLAFGILQGFLLPPLLALVIGDTPLGRSLLAVGLATAKGATQIVATPIARVGQKENPALPTPGQAAPQVRLGAQDRTQQQIILQDQGGDGLLMIPVGLKGKMLRDLDCKKLKLSLKMLMLYLMSLSY